MSVTVTIIGGKALASLLKKKSKEIDSETEKNMLKCAFKVEADAKKLCPVSTGRLRSSITHQVKKKKSRFGKITGLVGTNVDYAKHVEFGTKRHLAPVGKEWASKHGFSPKTEVMWVSGKPQPYLYPALQKNFNYIRKLLGNAVIAPLKRR